MDFRKKVSAYLSRYGGVEVGAQDIYVGGDRRSTYRYVKYLQIEHYDNPRSYVL